MEAKRKEVREGNAVDPRRSSLPPPTRPPTANPPKPVTTFARLPTRGKLPLELPVVLAVGAHVGTRRSCFKGPSDGGVW